MDITRLAGGQIAEQWEQAEPTRAPSGTRGTFPAPTPRSIAHPRRNDDKEKHHELDDLQPARTKPLRTTFEDLFYLADAATMATFYAEDAEVMAPDTDPIRGRQAITAFFAAACQATQRLGMKRTITVRQVEHSGDLGYLLSTVVLELPATGGTTATTTFNDVTVWRRAADGRWLMVVDSANRHSGAHERGETGVLADASRRRRRSASDTCQDRGPLG